MKLHVLAILGLHAASVAALRSSARVSMSLARRPMLTRAIATVTGLSIAPALGVLPARAEDAPAAAPEKLATFTKTESGLK